MPSVYKSIPSEELKAFSDKLDIIIFKDAQREHYFTDIDKIKEAIDGNGKPGFNAIRDKVLSWDSKLTGLSMLVMGDIVFRVITMIYTK